MSNINQHLRASFFSFTRIHRLAPLSMWRRSLKLWLYPSTDSVSL
jgi:hypothetical protein